MRMILLAGAAVLLAGCSQGADQTESEDAMAVSDDQGSVTPSATPSDPAAEGTMAEVQPTACESNEEELFSCTAGAKRIAVCGITNAQGQKTAQYRYGSADKAEIVLDGGRFASVPYSGGGEAQVEFANGGTRYVVYSRTVRTNFAAGEPNNPEFTDGVLALSNGDVVADRQCTGKVESVDVTAGESYGGVASELFYYGD